MNAIYSRFHGFRIRPFQWLLVILLAILLMAWSPPGFAVVTQIEEYPGQMLYQSRQSLRDQTGKTWQAILFKRIHPEGSATISLRLVGFPGSVVLDHTQPLSLSLSVGKILNAKDISSEISQNTPTPTNVAEYDIKFLLPELQGEAPLQLALPVVNGSAIELEIPSTVIQEWQTLSDH